MLTQEELTIFPDTEIEKSNTQHPFYTSQSFSLHHLMLIYRQKSLGLN